MRRTAETRRLLRGGLPFETPAPRQAFLPEDASGALPCPGGEAAWRLRLRGREASGDVWVTRPDGSRATCFATRAILPDRAGDRMAAMATLLALVAGAAAAVETARAGRRELARPDATGLRQRAAPDGDFAMWLRPRGRARGWLRALLRRR